MLFIILLALVCFVFINNRKLLNIKIKKRNKENKKLKLNYKNTFLIGMAFFSITLLWTVYGQYCPLMVEQVLINSGICKTTEETLLPVGVIMALDNALALFMLPIFGTLSDKTKCSFGKRMIYVFPGMVAASIVFPFVALAFLLFPNSIWLLVALMGLVLIIMNIYRNPAVALMPDVTPKPLRSTANGIINFVGYIGGAIGGILMMIFPIMKNKVPTTPHNAIISFIIAAVFMLVAAIILVINVKENKLLKENAEALKEGERQSETIANVDGGEKLSKTDKRNLIIVLLGVLFWYFSFNALESFASLFTTHVLGGNYSGTIVVVLTATSLVSFILLINLPSKIGRKWTVLLGIGLMMVGFIGIIITLFANGVFANDYITFTAEKEAIFNANIPWSKLIYVIYGFVAFIGIGWALINANSYPMLVELSSGKDIGKYTGIYYTFSMVAQTLTPILAGTWMTFDTTGNGLKLLFVYSLIMIIVAGIIMLFFKEKKKVIEKSKIGFESLDND